MTTDPQTDPLDKAQRRGDHWKRMAQLLEADRDRADKALAHAEQRATALDAVLVRVRQMADCWEQQLPEVIRTPAVVSALRAALERADSLPPLDRRQLLDRAVAHLRSIPIQCTALTGPVWYGQGWKEAIDELEEFRDRVAAPAAVSPPPDRAALRKAVAHAIHRYDNDRALSGNDVPSEHHYGEADAVLAVLPEQDRADVLREAADKLAAMDPAEAALAGQHAWVDAANVLRRLAVEAGARRADETQPADREAVLREAIERVEDREERLGLGWESAREVLRRMLGEAVAEKLAARYGAEAPQPSRCSCTHARAMHTGPNLFCAVPGCECTQYDGAQQQTEGAAPGEALDLSDGPIRCPLCPYPVTLHTPNGARAHFTAVHPDQRLTGRGPGPWPQLATAGAEAPQQPDTEAPWASDGARIGRALIWSWADVGRGEFGRGYRAAQEEARALLTGQREPAPVAQQPARSRTARFLDALTHSGPGYDLTTPATEEQPAAEAHACGNCSGIDPDTCLTNPEQQPAAADTDEEPQP